MTMKNASRIAALLCLLGCCGVASADGPLYPISPGSPVWIDAEGDTWWCPQGASVCVPLDSSAAPIEP
jgi:hypothetical protein